MVDSAKMLTRQRMLQWAQFIRDCKASGLSVKAFCEGAGVRENTYYYWQKKLRDEACELLLMEQMGDEPATMIVPKGFAEVRAMPSFEASAGVLAQDEPTEVLTALEPVAVPAIGLTSSVAAPVAVVAAPIHASASPKATGQIQIESSGLKISADGTYPVDKLARVLKGLVSG